MELSASLAISDLPVFSTVLAGNPLQLRPKHVLPLKFALASRSSRSLHFRYRRFAVSLPRAAASDDSNGYNSPLITEERDSVTVFEDSPSASFEVSKEEPAEDVPVVTVEDSSSAENIAYNEIVASEEPKEEPVEDAQEQAFELLNDLKLESVDAYSVALYGTGAFLSLWLVSAIVGAVDSIPLVPKLLEVVGLGYTVWFTTRFLLFKESRDELATKIDEVKEQVLGSN